MPFLKRRRAAERAQELLTYYLTLEPGDMEALSLLDDLTEVRKC